MVKFRFAIILLSFFGILNVNAQSKRVPGVVVNYIPESTKNYIRFIYKLLVVSRFEFLVLYVF